MASTTNYGWTTPDDTALVKDGASAIRSLGTAIDTTVFNNASAGIPKTIVDAKGDLIAATASDTVSRLAVGTNNQVLMADSTAATGLKWGTPAAGSLTLLSTSTMSGTTFTVSSISQSYTNLLVLIDDYFSNDNERETFIRFNSDSGTNYDFAGVSRGTGLNSVGQIGLDYFEYGFGTNSTTAANKLSAIIEIYNYTTSQNKIVTAQSRSRYTTNNAMYQVNGRWRNSAAITSISFGERTGPTIQGGTVRIYGVN